MAEHRAIAEMTQRVRTINKDLERLREDVSDSEKHLALCKWRVDEAEALLRSYREALERLRK